MAWIQDFIMLQACEQSAGRMGTQAGTGGRWTGTDGAIDRDGGHLWGRGLEGGKEQEIDRDAHEPRAGDEGAAGLDGTFHPQASPGTWPPKAPSL